jgi:hypothetical protein
MNCKILLKKYFLLNFKKKFAILMLILILHNEIHYLLNYETKQNYDSQIDANSSSNIWFC